MVFVSHLKFIFCAALHNEMSAPNVRILFLPTPQLHRTRLAVHIKVEPIATREISMCVITWPMAWHSNIFYLIWLVRLMLSRRTISYTSPPPPILTVSKTALTNSFHNRLTMESPRASNNFLRTKSAGVSKRRRLRRIKDKRGIRKNKTDRVAILFTVKWWLK